MTTENNQTPAPTAQTDPSKVAATLYDNNEGAPAPKTGADADAKPTGNTDDAAAAAAQKATDDATAAAKAAAEAAEKEAYEKMSPDEKKAHDELKAKEAEEAAKAPVKVEDLALPEGFVADPEVMAVFGEVAADLKLNKEQAQKLVPVGAKIAEAIATRQAEFMAETRKEWREQVKNDKVIGSEAAMGIAKKGYNQVATPELKKLMDDTGLGDHPEFIRLFHTIGERVSEESTLVRGGNGAPSQVSPEDKMYTHPTS